MDNNITNFGTGVGVGDSPREQLEDMMSEKFQECLSDIDNFCE